MPFDDVAVYETTELFNDVSGAFATFKADRREHGSRLAVHHSSDDLAASMFGFVMRVSKTVTGIPRRGTVQYQQWIDNLWKQEPILAGAVYSMEAKMQSMTWRVEGGRNGAGQVARMLARARYLTGEDWSGFIGASAIDFYTQDNGVFWDVIRRGDSKWGSIDDLAHIDTRCCQLTGNAKEPMWYVSSLVSDQRRYKPWEYMHFTSMNLPDERDVGLGYCAVSRAARAAKLLMALHDYDAEKLSNLPPEGIASVTGLTIKEFRDALRLWQAERKKNNMLTFPQVLWLIGNTPNAKVSVDIASFSSIPESFDRQTVVSQYVNTLALCFGVDTREFWAISSGALGTASETEVQHLKARGKGGGEFISMVERSLNAELPENVVFTFDTQDIEEDMVAAGVAKAWIDAYIGLIYPPQVEYKALLDAKTFKRLLADKGVLPEWAVGDDRVTITSHEVHKDELEDIVAFIWQAGKLKERVLINLAADVIKAKGWDEVLKDKLPVTIEGESVALLKEHSRSKCMECDGSPEVDAHWADGRGRAWFCLSCFESWVKEESREVVRAWYVEDGEVVKSISDNPSRNQVRTLGSGVGPSEIIKRLRDMKEKRQRVGIVKDKDNGGPNIRGKPIADAEVERGTKITRKSVEAELKYWKTIPELAPYAGE